MIKLMTKTRQIILALTAFVLSSVAVAQDSTNPYALIEDVGTKAFARIAESQEAIQADPELLRTIVIEELLPHVDYRYAAAKIIGTSYKKTQKDQRDRFALAVRDYLVQTYAQVLTRYEDQTVVFEPSKSVDGKRIVSVRASIVDPRRPAINLDFKLRQNKKTKEWKAFDMVVEGISLLNSKRAELGSLIRQQGIDEVAQQLSEKSKRPIVKDTDDKAAS